MNGRVFMLTEQRNKACEVAANAPITGRPPQKTAATSFRATSTAQLAVAHDPEPFGGKMRAGPALRAQPQETVLCRSNTALVDNPAGNRSKTICWRRRDQRLPGCRRRGPPAQRSRTAHMSKDREKNRQLRKSEESSRQVRPESSERLGIGAAALEDHHGGRLSNEPPEMLELEREPSGNSSSDGQNQQRPRRENRRANQKQAR